MATFGFIHRVYNSFVAIKKTSNHSNIIQNDIISPWNHLEKPVVAINPNICDYCKRLITCNCADPTPDIPSSSTKINEEPSIISGIIENETWESCSWPWLAYIEGTRGPDNGILNTNFGWDANGIWFSGDAGANTPAYPIYTKFSIPYKCTTEVSVDFIYDDYESKNFGLCFYPENIVPEWKWDYINPTRIAAQYDSNSSGPSISGIVLTNESEMRMEFDTVYTCKFIYSPTIKPYITLETWIKCRLDDNNKPMPQENSILVDTKYINDLLPPENYRIGFTADNDILPPNKTYIQNLVIKITDPENPKPVIYSHTLKNIDSLYFDTENSSIKV